MDFIVSHPKFQHQQLSLKPAGMFRTATLMLNGIPVKRSKGVYPVRDDAGAAVAIKLKANFIDAVPVILIGTDEVRLVSQLRWFEYAWIGLPVVLIFAGGAVGGGIGAFAALSSSRIFRSEFGTGTKYFLTGLVTLAAFVIFVVFAVAIRLAFRHPAG